jgi:hypothetical protein
MPVAAAAPPVAPAAWLHAIGEIGASRTELTQYYNDVEHIRSAHAIYSRHLMIAAFVTVRNKNLVDFALINLTARPVIVALGRLSIACCDASDKYAVRGTTAEWILGRPAELEPR